MEQSHPSMSPQFDPSAMMALVVDENLYQRAISADILRSIGVGRVLQACNGAEAWDVVQNNNPDCLFTDWLSEPLDGLELTRRIRQSDEAPNRAMPIFMLTARGSRADVDAARLAGAHAFLRKPISVTALHVRLRAVVVNPAPFVTTASYTGPCRRRKGDPFYMGPMRRLKDKIDEAVLAEDDDVKIELAKARIAHLEAVSMKLAPGEPNSVRRVFAAARDLKDVAEQIEDAPLTHAATELVRYLETLGAASGLDFEAMRTHISALHQLAHLPGAMAAERMRVAHSLTKMVDKKLRQAAVAA
jgi:CheY-like chemotaxis protein